MNKPSQKSPNQMKTQNRKPVRFEEGGKPHFPENLFHTILEAVNLPITFINDHYEYEWVNTCYCRAQGKQPTDFIGKTVGAIWGREAFEGSIKENLDMCFDGHERKREAWINFSSWGRRYCETVYSPYQPQGGSGSFAIVITYDITERKNAEEEVRNSEYRFRNLSEASLEAIVFIENGIIVDANDALNRLFGYEGEDLRGRPATDFIVPERRLFTDERMRTRTEGIYETLGLRKDGSTFPIEVNPREFEIDGRRLRISAVRDLTENKKIEKQLRDYQDHLERLVEERTFELKKSEEKFRNIFENAIEGIYQSTPDGRFLSVNPALAQILGCSTPDELLQSISNIGDEIYANPERRKEFKLLIEREGVVRNFEIQARMKDGSKKHASLNTRAVKDENGKTLYYEGMVQDITERKQAYQQILMQRDLAMKLAQIDKLEEGLAITLEAARTFSGMECGGISLKDSKTGGFELVASVGLSKRFEEKVHQVAEGSSTWSRMMEKKSFHIRPTRELTPIALDEGFKFISVVPILQDEETVGFLVAASKNIDEIPEQIRVGLEFLAAELGSVIARMQALEKLKDEISVRRVTEKALEAERRSLEEANTALKVLLKYREDDKRELEEKLVSNVKQLVLPYVKKLEAGKLDALQRMTVALIDTNLNEIVSPFLNNMKSFKFTPRQLEIIAFIKEGRTTKEIAQLLAVGKDAIDLQRFLIRKKLGINKNKANLRSFLMSLG